MRTNFSAEQLAHRDLAAAEENLRACVHCGICTATCPTYLVLGDERDGPRGRIVLMQNMLEEGGAPTAETVRHIDRCLSCLGCRTACPSGVDYARLIDAARVHIATNHVRPWRERALLTLVARVLTRPRWTRVGVSLAQLLAPIAKRLPGRLGAAARLALRAQPCPANAVTPHSDQPRRVALMPGCVQQVLAPSIDSAAARVLERRGIGAEALVGAGCCGALAHHLGRKADAQRWAKRMITACEKTGDAFEAVVSTASGCTSHLRDYGHLFPDDSGWRNRAEAFAAKVRDFTELATPGPAAHERRPRCVWHPPCSLTHGLRLAGAPEAALGAAGFEVTTVPESHICCGSAGSYSLLQPEIAGALRARKLDHARPLLPDVIVSCNIGCITHLSGADAPPVIHLAEAIDWAEGGPVPAALVSKTRPMR